MKTVVLWTDETPRVAGHAAQRLAGGVAAGDGWHEIWLWMVACRVVLSFGYHPSKQRK